MPGSCFVSLHVLVLALAFGPTGSAPTDRGELPLGEKGPGFELTGVDGNRHRLVDLAGGHGTVIVFTSNRCPYSLLYEQRLMALARRWQSRGFAFIAINPNAPVAQAGESLEDMKSHAESRRFPFPYLSDPDQTVSDRYSARVTPHVFILDAAGKLVYRGRIDDSALPDKVTVHDLEDALRALAANEPVATSATRAFGCAIKRAHEPAP